MRRRDEKEDSACPGSWAVLVVLLVEHLHGMQCVARPISAYCFSEKVAVFGHSCFALPGLFDLHCTGWNDAG